MPLRSKKPQKVVVDGRAVGPVQNGVARSILTMAKGLAEQSKLGYELVFLCRPGFSAAFSGFETVEVKTPFLDPRENLTIPAILWRQRGSLYHSPTHSSLFSAPCPWVVTLHDLIPMRWGSPIEQLYFQGVVAPFAARAARILTVSNTVKGEIETWLQGPAHAKLFRFGLTKGKKLPPVETVYNAIDPYFIRAGGETDEVLRKFGLERGKFFFCLTNEKLHKNASVAIRAFQMAKEQLDLMGNWKLVVTSDRFKDEPGVLAVGNLKDADTLALLRATRALLFPSLEEGFGLPPIEGGVVGTPLIVSDIGVHREVLSVAGSDEVRFVDPHHPILWTRALLDAAAGAIRPWSFATRQKALAEYSVQRLGEHMDRIYRDVLGEKA